MQARTLLLVEDDRVERRLLLHGLKDHYRVLEAAGPDQAIHWLTSVPVDLVVMDLHLSPDPQTPSGGMRLGDWIAETIPGLPVIVLTSNRNPEVEREVRRRGVVDFLKKPAPFEVVLAAVSRALPHRGRPTGGDES